MARRGDRAWRGGRAWRGIAHDDRTGWNAGLLVGRRTVTTGGHPCLHYEESSGGFQLTVGADTVSEMISGTAGIDLTCPDGTAYSNSNALALLNCPGSAFGDLPGNTTSSDSTSVTFGLIDTGTPSSIAVFDCNR